MTDLVLRSTTDRIVIHPEKNGFIVKLRNGEMETDKDGLRKLINQWRDTYPVKGDLSEWQEILWRPYHE